MTVRRCILQITLCILGVLLLLPAGTQAADANSIRIFEANRITDVDDPSEQMLPNFLSPCQAGNQTVFNGLMGMPQAGKTTGQWANRIFRNAVASVCSPQKACPGNFTAPSRWHDIWPMDAFAQDRCITVVANGGSCGATFDAHPSAFCGTYPAGTALPANCLAAAGIGYKGDTGSSPGLNANIAFSFCIPANTAWSIVVENSNTLLQGCSYSFTVSCAAGTCAPDANCGGGGQPPPGPCNLAPIEAKLDAMAPQLDVIEAYVDSLENAVASLEAKLDTFDEKFCDIIRLLHTPQGIRVTTLCGGYEWNPDGIPVQP